MTLTHQDFPLVAGDSHLIEFAVTENGVAADLTGATALRWGCVKRRADGTFTGAAVVTKALGSGVEITDAAGGVIQVTLDPDDTAELPAGAYYHELELTDAGGAVITLATGTLNLAANLLT